MQDASRRSPLGPPDRGRSVARPFPRAEKYAEPPELKCDMGGRIVTDAKDIPIFVVRSTFKEDGTFSPIEADILGKMLRKYLSSAQFKMAWPKAVVEYFKL
jgi:hypothetical protein